MIGIYKIVSKSTGDFYIGQSVDTKNRWKAHLSNLRKGEHGNYKLQELFDKFGEDNFEILLLEKCGREDLCEREQHYIDTLHPTLNINLDVDSFYTGHPPREYRDIFLVSPEGQVFTEVINLNQFCLERGLTYTAMFNLLNHKGYTKSYLGWCLIEDYEEPDFVEESGI